MLGIATGIAVPSQQWGFVKQQQLQCSSQTFAMLRSQAPHFAAGRDAFPATELGIHCAKAFARDAMPLLTQICQPAAFQFAVYDSSVEFQMVCH